MRLFNPSAKHFTRIAWLGVALVVIIAAVLWSNDSPFKLPFNHELKSTAAVANHAIPGSKAEPKLPEVNGTVLKDQGDLAFIQDGLLYVLEGKSGRLTRLSESGQALRPLWSYDGQWLAYIRYIRVSKPDETSGSLWLVKRDGTQSHQVQGLPGVVNKNDYSWSPKQNLLAVSCQGIWLIREQDQPEQVVQSVTTATPHFAWSPDGKQLAYNLSLSYINKQNQAIYESDTLYTLDISTGKTVQHPAVWESDLQPIAWWPDGKGILYWEKSVYAASRTADGADIMSLCLGEQEPQSLSYGLANREWLSLSSDGRLLAVAGGPRIAWCNKELEISNIRTGAATTIKHPQGSVALDPSFSPDARQIAFVAARDLGEEIWGFSKSDEMQAWINTRTLWVVSNDGTGARHLAGAGPGVYQPEWSRDGKHIMYIADDSVWMIDAQGKNHQKILGPLMQAKADDDFHFGNYGFVSYHDWLAWYKY